MKRLEKHRLDVLKQCETNCVYFKIQDNIYSAKDLDILKIRKVQQTTDTGDALTIESTTAREFSIESLDEEYSATIYDTLFSFNTSLSTKTNLIISTSSDKLWYLVKDLIKKTGLIKLFVLSAASFENSDNYSFIFVESYYLQENGLDINNNTITLERGSIETGPLIRVTGDWIIRNK